MKEHAPSLPGVYDNSATKCREIWHIGADGDLEIKGSVLADDVDLYMADKPPRFQMKWGYFPDVVKESL